MMQSIIYQKIIIMKLWISFIKGTKPFFFLKKERNILYWGPQALGLPPRPSIYKEQPLSCFFGLKRTTPFKLDKNGKCIKTQKANNRTSLQYAICKTKLYILCVHLRKLIPKRLICVFINTKFEKIPNFLFQGCPILVGLERALALLLLLLLLLL